MLLNLHSFHSLRYGVFPLEDIAGLLARKGYEAAVLTDINNSTGVLEFIQYCREQNIHALAGMEFREGDRLLYFAIARNNDGFAEINQLRTTHNLNGTPLPEVAPAFQNVFVVYPFGTRPSTALRDFEFLGVAPQQLNKLLLQPKAVQSKCLIWQPSTFEDEAGLQLHRRLRAIHHNILLSQLKPEQCADATQILPSRAALLACYKEFPTLIANTEKIFSQCAFEFDYTVSKNRKTFTGCPYDDKLLLEKLAMDGWKERYGAHHKEALLRVKKELAVVDALGFSAYFLTAWDVIRYSMSRGFYHVGRGSGANSVVAYCLKITDVCPIELDLYFERFLNPKRKSPPDFDIDYSWDQRDEVFDYIFKRYGHQHTAMLGATTTFRDRSIVRELGKVYGLPKAEIDRLIHEPQNIQNKNEITELILSVHQQLADFPNNRSLHPGGVLISDLPISYYTALDMPPKGFPTVQFDMYTAEAIGFEKLDILSQRGIGHIKDCADLVWKNKKIKVDVHAVATFKQDPKVAQQLRSGDSIGCFYIESPAMRGLLKKLRCSDYRTLVAASSIIRPGVAKSGMMKAYIERFHHPEKVQYLHPILQEQLSETYGVMVYQEDVLKVGHHYGGLDLADADVLRRLMSGKNRGRHHLVEIEEKFFSNCRAKGYDEKISREIWRQIESFAGYSFSKAHSASYAVESYQSLYLKTYYPLEFCTAVINNHGGFYPTRIYVNEAQKLGATVHLPCVQHSLPQSTIKGKDLYLGFELVQGLETNVQHALPLERDLNGPYQNLEDVILRNRLTLEQSVLLIRIGALRFTGKSKKTLLWETHGLLCGQPVADTGPELFATPRANWQLPAFRNEPLEDAYDEIELLGFPVSMSLFDLAKSPYRGDCAAKELLQHTGRTVRMVGNYVAAKHVRTVRGDIMNFGTFLDVHGDFFDTTHFPPSLKQYPFKGAGIYLLEGQVVDDFGYPSITVQRMAKMPVQGDPRGR